MTLHREGTQIIGGLALILALICFSVNYLLPGNDLALNISLGVSIVLFLVVVQFFRVPSITTPMDIENVIAPANGKVVVIEETEEPEYFKGKRRQISIFMSPIDVHVNRFPITGIVKYVKYHPGLFLVAWHPKASTDNERSTVVVQHPTGVDVLFRQIAGALAKRIVTYSKEGERATQGSEFGFIKFGSRVDIFLPLDAEIKVDLNQKTIGGETIIAKLPMS